jgi:6-phosphogluconolactonase (cycloisomerase 2 family)
VGNRSTNTLSQFSVSEPSGYLSAITSPIGADPSPVSIAFSAGKAQFAYANAQASNRLHLYRSASDGTLSINGAMSQVGTGTLPIAMAKDPRGRNLYVLNNVDSTIDVWNIDAVSGILSWNSQVGTSVNPTQMLVTPDGQHLYTISPVGNVITHHQIYYDGSLSGPSNYGVSAGSTPIAMSMDPYGKFLFVIKAAGPSVSSFRIQPDGYLDPRYDNTSLCSSASSITNDPRGLNFYVGCSTGQMYQFNYDIGSGAMYAFSPNYYYWGATAINSLLIDPTNRYFFKTYNSPIDATLYFLPDSGDVDNPSETSTGTGAYAATATFDPTGKWLYFSTSDSIFQNKFNPVSGAVSTLGPPAVATAGGAGTTQIILSP